MAASSAKRTATEADLVPRDFDDDPPSLPRIMYVYTNSDTVFAIDTEKLIARAPKCWLARVLLGRPAGSAEGESQDNPLRVSVPSWYIRGIVDWLQPISTRHVYFSVDDRAVCEILAATGWTGQPNDLPCHQCLNRDVSIMQDLESLLSTSMPVYLDRAVKPPYAVAKYSSTLVLFSEKPTSPPERLEFTNQIVWLDDGFYQKILKAFEVASDFRGKIRKYCLHSNGARALTLAGDCDHGGIAETYLLIQDIFAA